MVGVTKIAEGLFNGITGIVYEPYKGKAPSFFAAHVSETPKKVKSSILLIRHAL